MGVQNSVLVAVAILSLTACPRNDDDDTAPVPSLVAPATAAPTASSLALETPPACKVSAEKVWGTGANKLTGLTATELPDGRIAVGLALGLSPHVLVVGENGEGTLIKVPARAGTALARGVPAGEGFRSILRVTPVKVTETSAEAFVDYRDEYKNKRRRVACGPAEGDSDWIVFDDIPLLDRDPMPTLAERAALFAKKDDDGEAGYHELRDCRSFADVKSGARWIVGSEMRADSKFGMLKWKASLVIDSGPRRHETHLHEVELEGEAPRVSTFEVPMLVPLGDGFLLTARYAGSLLAAQLHANKRLHGKVAMYRGFPTRPDIEQDGDDVVVVTSVVKDKSAFVLRALRLEQKSPVFPASLVPVVTGDVDHASESDPDFLRDARGQRWISYIEGERSHGRLAIVPVDAGFQATGRSYDITREEDKASEARLVAMKDGRFLAVFLRDAGDRTELVTEELSCTVVPR